MTFVRRGCRITMERWSLETDGGKGLDREILADWIEFKNQDEKTILKMSINLWNHLEYELQGHILERMRKLYG